MGAWGKFRAHVNQRWTDGRLTRTKPGGMTTHCALGIIGYNEFEDWDDITVHDPNSSMAQTRLGGNARTRHLIWQLAEELRKDPDVRARFFEGYTDMWDSDGQQDQRIIMAVNDLMGQDPLLRAAKILQEREEAEEALRIDRETKAAANAINKMKIKKKDLKVEYQPVSIQEQVEKINVH